MLVILVFILVFLVYNNYVILNEHEVLVVFGNLIWVSIGSKVIVENIYVLLDDKGVLIRNLFIWYLKKKKTIYLSLIEYYNNRSIELGRFIQLNYYYPDYIVNLVLYNYSVNRVSLLATDVSTKIYTIGLTLKREFVFFRLNKLLDNFSSKDTVVKLFLSDK